MNSAEDQLLLPDEFLDWLDRFKKEVRKTLRTTYGLNKGTPGNWRSKPGSFSRGTLAEFCLRVYIFHHKKELPEEMGLGERISNVVREEIRRTATGISFETDGPMEKIQNMLRAIDKAVLEVRTQSIADGWASFNVTMLRKVGKGKDRLDVRREMEKLFNKTWLVRSWLQWNYELPRPPHEKPEPKKPPPSELGRTRRAWRPDLKIRRGRFELKRRLDHNGDTPYVPEVWEAENLGGHKVAIKRVPLKGPMGRPERKALRLIKKLRDAHLVPLYESWKNHRDLGVVMELAHGTLDDVLKRYPQGIPPRKLLGFMEDSARGIDFLHRKRIVHGDVKPKNLFRVGRGIKVGDYGTVTKLKKGEVLAACSGYTSGYESPEQKRGQICCGSDQFMLARTYLHLRTGRFPPAIGTTSMLPEKEVVRRALQPEPSKRYSSCAEFVRELRKAIFPSSRREPKPEWGSTVTERVPSPATPPAAKHAPKEGLVHVEFTVEPGTDLLTEIPRAIADGPLACLAETSLAQLRPDQKREREFRIAPDGLGLHANPPLQNARRQAFPFVAMPSSTLSHGMESGKYYYYPNWPRKRTPEICINRIRPGRLTLKVDWDHVELTLLIQRPQEQ